MIYAPRFFASRLVTEEEKSTMMSTIAGTEDEALLRNVWLFDEHIERELQGPVSGLTTLPDGGFLVYPFPERRLLCYANGRIRVAKEIYFISFDSNFNEQLSAFFGTGVPKQSGDALVMTLLHRLRAWTRVDAQSYIGVLEHFAKAEMPYLHVLRYVENVLRLHALDLEVTLACGYPRYDDEIVARQQNIFQSKDFPEMAQFASRGFALPSSTDDHVNLLYAALIRMVNIQRSSERSYARRVAAFDDFVQNELEIESLRLHALARYFFSGRMHKFVGVENNTPREQALKRLNAAAWDLYVASSPERIMSFKEKPYGLLTVLVTRDKSLAEVASQFTVKSVAVFNDNGVRSRLSWSDSLLAPMHGAAAVEEDLRRLTQRLSRPYRPNTNKSINIKSFEAEL